MWMILSENYPSSKQKSYKLVGTKMSENWTRQNPTQEMSCLTLAAVKLRTAEVTEMPLQTVQSLD
jgi:hypothetical protein